MCQKIMYEAGTGAARPQILAGRSVNPILTGGGADFAHHIITGYLYGTPKFIHLPVSL